MSSRGSGALRRVRWVVAALGVALVGAACTPPPTPEEQVDQLVAFVESIQGHEFVTEPVIEFVDPAAFQADYLARIAAVEPDVDKAEVAFEALDWIEPGTDLFALYQQLGGDGVVGFYDTDTQELKVRGASLTAYRKEVIVHELTHALDDQIHGLTEDFGDGFLGERTFAALVAIEGSAERVRQTWYNTRSPLEQLDSLSEQLSLGVDPDLLGLPLPLLTLSQAPYLRGVALAAQATSALGTPGGVDELLTRYPATAEQAFDYAKYEADEPATPVATPPADGPVVESGSWGQFLLSSILRDGIVLDQVDPVTLPWAGDAYVTWDDGSERCLRLDTLMDTPAAGDALEAAFASWTTRHPGGAVDDLGGGLIRFTACS